jgi:hypothetical protein
MGEEMNKKGSFFNKVAATTKSNEPLLNNNKEIISKNTTIDKKNLTIEEISDNLFNEFKLENKYVFTDIEQNQLCVINYDSIDPFDKIKYYGLTMIEPTLQSMCITLQQKGFITGEVSLRDKKQLKKIKEGLRGVKKSFNRKKPEMYIDTDNLPTLNMFKRTPLIEYEVKERKSWKELKEILKKQYPRLQILLNNNIGKEEEYQRWFLNWVSNDINDPDEMQTTFVLIGEQGSGKSILVEQMFRENIYDKTNVCILDNKQLKDNFNDIYNFKSFVIMNEVSTMDLKENNQIAQDLKRLITDGTYINRGMFKAGAEKVKTFNMGFCTNKNTPVQIEHGDRRFTVFGRGQKLELFNETKNFLKDNNEKFSDFIKHLKVEIKNSLYTIKELDYDSDFVSRPLMTPLKKSIIQTSNKKEDLMKSYISSQEYSSLELLLKQYEEFDELFFYKLECMFNLGIITNDMLYRIYVNIFSIVERPEDEQYTKGKQRESGAFFNKILETDPVGKVKLNGKTFSYKVFDLENIDEKKNGLKELLNNIEKGNIFLLENEKGEISVEDKNIPF